MTASGSSSVPAPDEAVQTLIHEREALDHLSEIATCDGARAGSATETLEREVQLGLRDDLREQRSDVDDALLRVAEGRYGICERCGQPIPTNRLRALPAARCCLDCQVLVETWRSGAGF